MEEFIELRKLINILKKRFRILIVVPIVCLIMSVIFSVFLMKPIYSTSTQVLVSEKKLNSQVLAQQLQSNLQLMNTYTEIIKSPRILNTVSRNLNDKYSSDEILSMITVSNHADSQILNIEVRNESREAASKVANEVAKVFSKDVSKIMKIDNVSILSKAEHNGDQVSPKPLVNAGLSIVIGVVLAIMTIFTIELFDKRIKNEEEVESILGLPVLGTIYRFENEMEVKR
ncbi:Wzz/FepE/Etk N-terminal domain-containing protein [Mammaliicoccus stepanovicii]|uniref:Capsular polysaccharide biosynthesis protein n=1 Tax=Mammaliicoccus stepanovicii TaxID=643214 RepID=A0A240A5G3_9STAP|nr:Wzz/FepE/Etk N-terminal domain-containing protein [Mammaliicoccus stepanovicii]PNZ71886.1 capsule biosynthesis protein CapA [Mammaliicoccus stepanovicii]GGI39517.1 capsular polysaccharide biosynthesis protein CapA [Mammaliicoccus stepanovicii]SNV78324.1 capsular polysaccharide biosynthesis protein [Mammaliicoccus stepanovicii]